MANAQDERLTRLTSRGLVLTRGEYGWASRGEVQFSVMKPRGIRGNSVPDRDVWMGLKAEDDRESDAPTLSLFSNGGNWVVLHHKYIPGPGPGDFRHEYGSLAEAVADVLDFFFGNPARVQAVWRAQGLG